MKNYYRILELAPDAGEEAIEAAYVRLARRYRPEANPSKEAAARLKKINEAYEVLSDPSARQKYDAARERRPAVSSRTGAPGEQAGSRGRRLLLAGGAIAVVAAAAGGIIAAVLLAGGGDGDETSVRLLDSASLGATATVNAAGAVPPVIATPTVGASGLQVIDLEPGTGDEAPAGATVTVDYTGWLDDGTVFDTSLDDEEPYTTSLAGGVIAGWQQGIPGMKVGGKRRLIIPPELAYGAQGRQGIPPNATLTFDIELLAVEPAPTAPAP